MYIATPYEEREGLLKCRLPHHLLTIRPFAVQIKKWQNGAQEGSGGKVSKLHIQLQLTAPKTQMTNMLTKKEIERAMVDSIELYLIPSFTSTGSLLEMALLCMRSEIEEGYRHTLYII